MNNTNRNKIYSAGLAVLILSAMMALPACQKSSPQMDHHHADAAPRYHCPMHPTYVSDKPGDCPICGMRLVRMESSDAPAAAPDLKPLFYRHPMNPDVTSPTPMKDEMGMDYVPVFPDETTAGGLSDRAPVRLSAERQQLIGVRTAPVARKQLANFVRASGRVAYDPDLFNAMAEHRQALQTKESVKNSPWPDVKERADALVRSSALRLRQMGLGETQIRDLAAQEKESTSLLLADKGGSVWIYAQIFEYESGLVKRGQKMEVVSTAAPGHRFEGRVAAVDSILDPQSRTLRVRGTVPNPDGLLKPEMFVDTIFHVTLGEKLAIPEEAVLKTGTRYIAFVETVPGQFEPRDIRLGAKAEDHYEVLAGVKEGERVVTSANFLIDSESKLKAALR